MGKEMPASLGLMVEAVLCIMGIWDPRGQNISKPLLFDFKFSFIGCRGLELKIYEVLGVDGHLGSRHGGV